MNILYCGDYNILDGLIISIYSLIKNTTCDLNIYVLTMDYKSDKKVFKPLNNKIIDKLNIEFKKIRNNINIKLYNITDITCKCLPIANISTRFTPYCMLRLYADQIDNFPNKILYLDNDVVAYNNPQVFYDLDITKYDLAGVLDNYGSHFFKKKAYKKDYLNSGVLLLNMDNIKKHKVFQKAIKRCKYVKMLMPNQTAINIYAKHKLIVNKKYNDQASIKKDTVFRHYTTTFKFIPKLHTQTIKPWDIEKMHTILKDYAIDDIYNEYLKIKNKIK